MDIIDQYIRIAFADVTDFVKIENGKLKLIDADSIDGQLITKIRQGPHGITIELADKLRAMEKLEHYFDVMPKDWRQKIEEKKLELMRERIEIERIKAGQQEVEDGDDGFIEALKDSAKETWGDE
jgi:phage terminase small subunit